MASSLNLRRDFSRYDTDVSVTLTSLTLRMSVRMLSVSAGGALVRLDRLTATLFEDDTFYLEILGVGRFPTIRKWRRDTDIGAKFELTEGDRNRLADRLEGRFAHRVPPRLQQVMPSLLY
ncbi:MAG: PilZ domain-containing protein [bacterium]